MHECKYYIGRIKDVTLRKTQGVNSIHCRKCGSKLQEHEIDPETYKNIKKGINNNGGKKWQNKKLRI